MNAAIETQGVATARAISPATKFKTLLRREYWENRGGFFWAPVIAGGISLFFSILAAIASMLLMRRTHQSVDSNYAQIAKYFDIQDKAAIAGIGGDLSLFNGIAISLVIFVFVVFFYSLGALYDERKDRSVLFWKSLPVSDTHTVLSKLAWALVLGPLVATSIGVVYGIGHWLIGALMMAINGSGYAAATVTHAHPFTVVFNVIAMLPVYAGWAMPTIGWLMFCSAWARRLPFLWAVLVPLLGAAMISWMDAVPGIDIPHGTVWYVLGLRGLLSIVPLTWYANSTVNHSVIEQLKNLQHADNPSQIIQSIHLGNSWSAFATLDMWLGIAIGVAFIVAAIRLRRWRDEG